MSASDGFFETLQQLNRDLARALPQLEAATKDNEHLREFEIFAREQLLTLKASVDAALTKIDTVYKAGKRRDEQAEKALEEFKDLLALAPIISAVVKVEAHDALITALQQVLSDKVNVEEFKRLAEELRDNKQWRRTLFLAFLAAASPYAYDLIKAWLTVTGKG